MKVLVFEDNLIWSSRLLQSIRSLGHEPVLIRPNFTDLPEGEVAILNLGSAAFAPEELVSDLRSRGTYVVGHGGHKEGDILQRGRDAGCDAVVSNSTLTFKLADVLANVPTAR